MIVVLSVVALALCYLVAREFVWFYTPVRSTTGELSGYKTAATEDGASQQMMVRFTDESGEDHIFVDSAHSLSQVWPKGAPVEVFYPSGRPDLARCQSPSLVRLMILVALLLIMLGFILTMTIFFHPDQVA